MILSIITPCYNSENYIEEAIQSFLLQNNKNIELIIVDDGSIDCTEEICKKYICNNINYIKTENLGAGHARNIGIGQASGKWISFLDSDDLYLINSINDSFFEKLLEYENMDIIYTPRIKIDMELNNEPEITYPEEIDSIENNMPKLEFWTCIYKSSFLRNNNIKFYEYSKQDIETAFRFLAFSNTKKIVTDRQIKFYLQRDNLQSNTHTWNLYNLYEIKGKVYYDLYNRNKDIDSSCNTYLLEIVIMQIYKYYLLCLKNGWCGEKEIIYDMHYLFSEIKKCKEISDFCWKSKFKYTILSVIDKFYKNIFKYAKKDEVVVKLRDKSKKSIKNNHEEILHKLGVISKKIKYM